MSDFLFIDKLFTLLMSVLHLKTWARGLFFFLWQMHR